MDIYNLILKRRTIRKFQQKSIDKSLLMNCLNAARLAPSSANLQPLEYILVTERENLEKVFSCTRWAGYAKEAGPKRGEEPVAYILILSNQEISKEPRYDVGLAAENIILTALERGIASCVIGALDRIKLAEVLKVPENYTIELAIALGYPKQESLEDEVKKDVRYWLDDKGKLHIPKRKLKDIAHEEGF